MTYKKKLNLSRLIPVALIASLTLLLIGCGANTTNAPASIPANQVSQGACPSSQIALAGACYSSQTWAQACLAAGGSQVTVANRQLCRISHLFVSPYGGAFTISGYNTFPRLNPNDPSGPYAYNTGIAVKKGDRLTYSGSGDWGGSSSESWSWLGGLLGGTVWTTDCSIFTATGYKGGSYVTHQGVAAGLVASDGTEVFLLGYSKTNRLINNDGSLRFGINAPLGSGTCANITITQLRIDHCEDASGTTYPCS